MYRELDKNPMKKDKLYFEKQFNNKMVWYFIIKKGKIICIWLVLRNKNQIVPCTPRQPCT